MRISMHKASLFRSLMAVVSLAVFTTAATLARADENSEMVIKAVMIRKFVEFIKWPDAVAPQKQLLVKVCVYGDSPMANMDPVFEKASSSPVKYSLKTVGSASEAAGCHVVFIGSSKTGELSGFTGKPVLTVSDAGGFAERGGMIGFQLIDGKVRYNINNKAFGAAGLKIDAQLLEIANKVVD